MFKWVWLIILGLIWFSGFWKSVKDVVLKIKWCKEHNKRDFYNRFEDETYGFLFIHIFLLFVSSLMYFMWSL